uniref:EF-hand domain-containing protein n=1 Tax=Anopheles atroparvus TaxID=41427 RepID=A0AAG5D6A9_ANOAO
MSSSSTMGAAGKNPSAVGEQPAGGNHTVQLLDPAHSSLSELSSELSSPAETSAAAKAHSEPARSVNSNFLTARAAREGTPPRADAQIEVGLPPRVPPPQGEGGSASGEPANSAESGTAPGDRQPKRKVIRRIVKVRRVVKKMKKKDEKFYLRTAFDLLDRDQDGHVTPEELQFMLRNLGIHVRDELIDDLLREASRTGSGLIDETEFLQWVARIQALKDDSNTSSSSSSSTNPAQSADDDLTQDLVAAFRVFDRDGNGYITRDELKSAMDMIGENVTEYQLNEMLELADADKDGRINYEEFARLLL